MNGKPLYFTRKEYQTLEALSLSKGRTLTRLALMDYLYGHRDEPQKNVIDALVCKVRKKLLHATGSNNYIETVWDRGYVLKDPTASF